MWALRKACNPIKKGLSVKTYRLMQAPLEVSNLDGYGSGLQESVFVVSNESQFGTRGYSSVNDPHTSFMGVRRFSSKSRTLSSGAETSSGDEDDDLEEGFSDLESSTETDAFQTKKGEDDLMSEDELSGEDSEDELNLVDVEGDAKEKKSYQKRVHIDDDKISEDELSGEDSGDDTDDLQEDELNLVDTEGDVKGKKSYPKRVHSELFKVIAAAANDSNLSGVLDKWVEEGNEVTREEISAAMIHLRKRRMYYKALQLSEWLESRKHLEYSEREYAARVDLIAKVHGTPIAETYMYKIPKQFRTEPIYRTLLANYVSSTNRKRAEDIFNKMKDLGFPLTSFACNQLLLLYKRTDKKKIADVLSLMEKEDVKPSRFTYILLIDTKGQSNDINGMEQIIETMKAEGVMPDNQTLAIMARHYTTGFLIEKAEAVLKEMEGNDLKENRYTCQSLLTLYAALGKAEEVRRIWKVCESNPRLDECMAAIEAWGKLKNVEEAEAIFEKMTTNFSKLSPKHYTVLLNAYAESKMLAKGKDLVKQMADKGFNLGPLTWDAIVKLYAEAGEVEKADSVLQRVSEHSRLKPMFNSYMTLLNHYANRGDVHNTEKIFHRMERAGYVHRIRQFQTLIKAYANSGTPAYGFNERMKAANVIPTRGFLGQISLIDPFKKTAASELLD